MNNELSEGTKDHVFLLIFVLLGNLTPVNDAYFHGRIFTEVFDRWADKTAPMSESERLFLRDKSKEMFEFGWDNYIRFAFPMDELDPIHCTGRGPDYDNPSNININDVLGDYSLTLIDALDTLVVMQNRSEFHRAVELVIEYVSFEKDNTVQVFEATIRVLGALLSAHMILTDQNGPLGDFRLPGYNDELLTLAHDLADRLVPAFEGTNTGLPYPRVNLMYGVPEDCINETCTAGAGSLLLEFGVLSRLLNDPTFEGLARRTNKYLWDLRDKSTGLLGNQINIQTGEWRGLLSGLGAGLDSFYEYMMKSFILFGNEVDYRMFNQSYSFIKEHLRRGRMHCNEGFGDPPIYVNVHMKDGATVNTWIDSLQASFAGVQILAGDVDEAICHHALFYSIWKKYGVLPERFNWQLKAPDVTFYPLRPEFAEATYLLYMSTKNPFYLHVGREIIESLNEHTRVRCGFATVHDVHDKSLEDRMESFFLSETCKYLFLLYDFENPVNKHFDRLIFTTEGHIIPVDNRWRTEDSLFNFDIYSTTDHSKEEEEEDDEEEEADDEEEEEEEEVEEEVITVAGNARNNTLAGQGCKNFPFSRRYVLPLQSRYLEQLYDMVGLDHTEF